MGSGKHKHKSKKKKHHYSSDSDYEKEREKHHKRHKKHHKSKKEKTVPKLVDAYGSTGSSESSDDEVIILSPPPPPKISRRSSTPPSPPPASRARHSPSPLKAPPAPSFFSENRKNTSNASLSIDETNRLRAKLKLKPLTDDRPKPAEPSSGGSLSVDETNRLREKLGLKPLDTSSRSSSSKKETYGGVDMGEFVHKPAESITDKKQTEKLKEKLTAKKEKRLLEEKLLNVKKLTEESDSDDDVRKWVEKNRKIVSEKEKAEKMAKELDAMDEVFGIGDLIEESIHTMKRNMYTSKDLKGLKVEHSLDNFAEGRDVVLTLKDKGVLDEDDDSLVNVNMLDSERYQKNIDRRKQKPGYNAYDDEEFDEIGEIQEKSVLRKYDEEIGGEKKSSFTLGIDNTMEAAIAARKEAIRAKLQKQAGKRLESLSIAPLQQASDYFTEEEINVKFRKPKKVKKVRKKLLKADDLLQENGEEKYDARNKKRMKYDIDKSLPTKEEPTDYMDTDDLPALPDVTDVKLEEEEDDDSELQVALKKARKLKQTGIMETKPKPEKVAASVVKSELTDETIGGAIVLNETAEFCRTLGDIPTYGQAGNREDAQLLDFERELEEKKRQTNEKYSGMGTWSEVDNDTQAASVASYEKPILDVEPELGGGVAGALKLAASKGYIEKEKQNRPSASKFAHLQAQNYSIEDKTFGDDNDKHSRRERYSGPAMDFREKDSYKPEIKLEYIDDEGRLLSAKEAFRYLSHKFHGKGPGKNKIEKRMKKNEQEALMKHMSSTDTPLGTLNMLQLKQKETQSPFVVLSGTKHGQSTSISKYKV